MPTLAPRHRLDEETNMRTTRALVSALVLSACGGGGDDAPPPRGTVLAAQVAGQATVAEIDAGAAASGLQRLSGAAQCDVEIRYVLYMTRDPAGAPATASAGVLVPSGSAAACGGERPVVLYAHGTTTDKRKNMADVVNDSEAALLMAMFAAQGFIVVAPNYLGYERSSLPYHPYLDAEGQAVDMIDGLRAAKASLAASGAVRPSGKLFVTGYSQGGHVAMATHRALERDHAGEFAVTASGPMSGPYNMSRFLTTVLGSPDACPADNPNCTVNVGATVFTPLLLTSWQRAYGDLYASPSDAYNEPYAATAPTLFPSTTPVDQVIAAGQLPPDPTLRALFGPGGLLKESLRTRFFSEADNPIKRAAEKNSLLGWTARAPIALCYTNQDPVVFGFNSVDAQAVFAARGVPVVSLDLRGDVATIDAALGASAAQLAGAFQQSFGADASNDHGNAAPFCTAFVRGVFSTL
jgi:poly(3-hydroxybutyrate) depolymerase